MKTVVCFQCGYQRKRGDPLTHPCPRCRRDWRKPSLFTRLKIALHEGCEAFKDSGLPKGYHERVFRPKQSKMDDYIDIGKRVVDIVTQDQAEAQGYETDPRD